MAQQPSCGGRRDRCYASIGHRRGSAHQGRASDGPAAAPVEGDSQEGHQQEEEIVRLQTFIRIAAVVVLGAAPLAASPSQTASQAKPDAKPAPLTTGSFVGKWTVNVDTQQGAMQSALEFKLDEKDAKKLRGTLVSQMGEAPVEGEFTNGKLLFWIAMNANGTELSLAFTGEPQKDGSLAGTLDVGGNAINWTAVRVKN
jgi:hypothetical protein